MIQAKVEAEPPTLGTEVFIDKGCQVDELINPYICLSCVCVYVCMCTGLFHNMNFISKDSLCYPHKILDLKGISDIVKGR